jgi:hypothetical protein
MFYKAFIVINELELLEARLHKLVKMMARFIVVESPAHIHQQIPTATVVSDRQLFRQLQEVAE